MPYLFLTIYQHLTDYYRCQDGLGRTEKVHSTLRSRQIGTRWERINRGAGVGRCDVVKQEALAAQTRGVV